MSFCAHDECNSRKPSDRECGPESPCRVPWHFRVHRQGVHFESCCGVCNLFPGVLVVALCQIFGGVGCLCALLAYSEDFDGMFDSKVTSIMTGGALSAIVGAGVLLVFVAVTENGRLMMVYLFVSAILWLGMLLLSMFKICSACYRFRDAILVKEEAHKTTNLACSVGLLCFLVCVLYFFGFVVVFSFYHFRYVRRAIYMHEAKCMCD